MKIRINILIFVFILFFYITNQLEIYAMLMIFVLFHEMGHMITGLILKLKINYIEIMPFGFSVRFDEISDNKLEVKKKNINKIMVAVAGPLVNIMLIICIIIGIFNYSEEWIYANLLIAIFNLLPIYPLDGGRILEAILDNHVNYEKKREYIACASKTTMVILTAVSSILVLYYKNILLVLGVIYMWIMTSRSLKI